MGRRTGFGIPALVVVVGLTGCMVGCRGRHTIRRIDLLPHRQHARNAGGQQGRTGTATRQEPGAPPTPTPIAPGGDDSAATRRDP